MADGKIANGGTADFQSALRVQCRLVTIFSERLKLVLANRELSSINGFPNVGGLFRIDEIEPPSRIRSEGLFVSSINGNGLNFIAFSSILCVRFVAEVRLALSPRRGALS